MGSGDQGGGTNGANGITRPAYAPSPSDQSLLLQGMLFPKFIECLIRLTLVRFRPRTSVEEKAAKEKAEARAAASDAASSKYDTYNRGGARELKTGGEGGA